MRKLLVCLFLMVERSRSREPRRFWTAPGRTRARRCRQRRRAPRLRRASGGCRTRARGLRGPSGRPLPTTMPTRPTRRTTRPPIRTTTTGDVAVSPEEKELAAAGGQNAAFSDIPDDVADEKRSRRAPGQRGSEALAVDRDVPEARAPDQDDRPPEDGEEDRDQILVTGREDAELLAADLLLLVAQTVLAARDAARPEEEVPEPDGALVQVLGARGVRVLPDRQHVRRRDLRLPHGAGRASQYTNPATAIAAGTFDTLDDDADYFTVMGKELFAPTLDQMKKHPDEQPGVLIMQNGMKVVKDAKVFVDREVVQEDQLHLRDPADRADGADARAVRPRPAADARRDHVRLPRRSRPRERRSAGRDVMKQVDEAA